MRPIRKWNLAAISAHPRIGAWTALLGSPETAAALRETWHDPPAGGLWALMDETFRLAGIDPPLGRQGLRYMVSDKPAPEGGFLLAFRATAAAEWLAPAAAPALLRPVPPWHWGEREVRAGEPFDWRKDFFLSMGGAGRGLTVSLRGAAVEQGLVRNLRSRLRGNRPNRVEEQPLAPAVEDPSGELKARFDSWTIPAGLRDKATWKAALDRHPDTAQARISLETSLFLLGDGGQAGEATCLLGVEPLEHPGGGAEYEIPVRSKGAGT